MANTTRWVIDTSYTTLAFATADTASLPSGGAALGTGTVNNATNLDQYMDVSFIVTVGGTTVAGSYITVFLLPLNQDNGTYGDAFASSTTTQPSGGYAVGSIGVKVGVASGSTVVGTVQFVNIPPGVFKIAFGNNLQVPFAATSGLGVAYRTYNVNLNV